MRRSNAGNGALFWPVMLFVALLDFATKRIALERLHDQDPVAVAGDWLRMTLVRNPGAAFGLNVGTHSRLIFTVLTVVALAILGRLYLGTRRGDAMRVLALALVCGGAVGNLVDRIASAAGVVDFIDMGVSELTRWPTFNVADMAVSFGAFLLAWVLWEEDRDAAPDAVSIPVRSVVREPGEV